MRLLQRRYPTATIHDHVVPGANFNLFPRICLRQSHHTIGLFHANLWMGGAHGSLGPNRWTGNGSRRNLCFENVGE